MNKFPNIEYKRADLKNAEKNILIYNKKLKDAKNFEEVKIAIDAIDKILKDNATIISIAHIRHTLDTSNTFYEAEQLYYNKKLALVMAKLLKVYKTIINSPYINDIINEYGQTFIDLIKLEIDSNSKKLILLMIKEAMLCNKYQKLMSQAKIELDGQTYNLYGIKKYLEHPDRNIRQRAYLGWAKFFENSEEEFEKIFDKLVKIRTKMGKKMGFDNYTCLGYMKQGRLDYGEKEVENFRRQVLEEIVPYCEELYKRQMNRTNIKDMKFYDETFHFLSGNAEPIGTIDEMLEITKKMYHELSNETKEFIDFMLDYQLLDLENRANKASTGYCTALPAYNAPYVFACFNKTTGDVHVLTHELGHAFATYTAMRKQKISNYYSPSTDIAEIHSMGMEQFCYPWAEEFFKDQADKFRYTHMMDAVTFIPYGVAVDEFQHIIYANPKLTPKERTLKWKELEAKYMPWRKYDGNEFLERGGFWYQKIHIFLYPFYYINYTLTSINAFEIAKKNHENPKQAWQDYYHLCTLGASKSYKDLLKEANLSIPFEDGCVKKTMQYIKNVLDNTDESKLK